MDHITYSSGDFSHFGRRQTICRFLCVAFVVMMGFQSALAYNNRIFWHNSATGERAKWEISNGWYQNNHSIGTVSSDLDILGVGDLNRDGSVDVISRTWSGENAIFYSSYGDYSYSTSPSWIQPLTLNSWKIVGVDYFDGPNDGSPDILWRNTATGDNAIWYMDKNQLISSVLIQELTDINWNISAVADFNNDGYPDLVWRHSTNGLNYVWYMQGANLISTAQLPTESNTNWVIKAATYFNSDNKPDLLWRNTQTGDNGIWFMDGTSLVSTRNLPWSDTSWRLGGAGYYGLDIDADSLGDLWERRYFGNLSQNGSGNPDGDAYSNSTEHGMFTNPAVPENQYQIGNEVEAPQLTWSHNYGWTRDPYDWSYGGSSIRLYGSSNSENYMSTTVSGPGTLMFRWKVSSESGYDLLKFYIDGVQQTYISGDVPWNTRFFSISSGNHTVKWSYNKDGSGTAGSDCGWVDLVEYYTPGNGSTNLQEALDHAAMGWTGNTSDWPGQTNIYSQVGGGDAVQVGPFSPYSSTSTYIETSVNGPGIFSYHIKGAAEGTMSVGLDGQPVNLLASIELPGGWTWNRFEVPWGTRTVRFGFGSGYYPYGVSAGWLDKVAFLQDSDMDGLPDKWEEQYFGSYSVQGSVGDYDADGVSNLQEYLNSTRPDVPELKVKITSLRPSSNLP